jgi:hypothetical protein
MHLKNIPEGMARDIKSRAAKLGYSPSQYFIYLHMRDQGHHFEEQPRQNQSKKKKKRR